MALTETANAADELVRGRPATTTELANRAEWIRLQAIELIGQAGFGHYSSTLSCAEIYSVLYYRTMRLRPEEPHWPDRDRFLLGKGHVACGLWPILADLGFYPSSWLKEYGQITARLTDHPNMVTVPGADFGSGSLGHNLSVGLGMALAGRAQRRDFRTFVLCGDGELQEGQIWEAAMAASHFGLGSLVAVVDANGYSGGDATSVTMNIEPLAVRFEAFGWAVEEIDGNDVEALVRTFDALGDPDGDQPRCIVSRTRKGKGLADMEAAPQAWHLGHMTEEERVAAVAEIQARLGR